MLTETQKAMKHEAKRLARMKNVKARRESKGTSKDSESRKYPGKSIREKC